MVVWACIYIYIYIYIHVVKLMRVCVHVSRSCPFSPLGCVCLKLTVKVSETNCMSSTSGFESSGTTNASVEVVNRKVVTEKTVVEEVEEQEDVKKETVVVSKKNGLSQESSSGLYKLEAVVMPLIFTGLAFFVRMYKIGANNHVVWDEAHFGKFGSYYLRHEFYHDVHPPLGKMLVGLSGYLAGYNGSWDFPSGQEYPEYLDYVKMRLFNATFSALCVPVAYFTAKAIGFSLPSVWLLTVLVLFENSYSTLGRFILLDSMLLFFTVCSFFCFVKMHHQRHVPFTANWWKWMALTGFFLGCTISVKMVGLFVISLVGIYTILDLWNFLGDKKMKWSTYIYHWVARIICLIIIPFLVFMACFKVHFSLLTHSGTGDPNMSSLFQANLVGNSLGTGPRDVALGSSIVSIRNHALGGALLHSHHDIYPVGSKQQQVTCYGHKDDNNNWAFDRVRGVEPWSENEQDIEYVEDGKTYRLRHILTGRSLHSHEVPAPLSKFDLEVSAYGNQTMGDEKDHWILEVLEQMGTENKSQIHPLTTTFRLKHAVLGCYLAQSTQRLPEWGFSQSEVICLKKASKSDTRTWWNVEDHINEKLPPRPEDFKYPKTNFFKDFLYLNKIMMATNNALVPDPDKLDRLASSAWEWPILHRGLRLCGWGDDTVKYYLLGTPLSTWASTGAIAALMIMMVILLIRWQRQYVDYKNAQTVNLFLMAGFYPLLGWGLHFLPFAIMSRVTYLHHYLPALYFALIGLVYIIEIGTNLLPSKKAKITVIGIFMLAVIACFAYFSPISFGMDKPVADYAYLSWLPNWDVIEIPGLFP